MTNTQTIALTPIGHVRGGRAEPIDDNWDTVEAEIALDPAQFGARRDGRARETSPISRSSITSTACRRTRSRRGARHPRGRSDWPKVGIFAQRGKNRPNRIGVTICRLLRRRRAHAAGARARRHRRHAGAGHQAGDERLSAARAACASRTGPARSWPAIGELTDCHLGWRLAPTGVRPWPTSCPNVFDLTPMNPDFNARSACAAGPAQERMPGASRHPGRHLHPDPL